jgi:hypothetical protein
MVLLRIIFVASRVIQFTGLTPSHLSTTNEITRGMNWNTTDWEISTEDVKHVGPEEPFHSFGTKSDRTAYEVLLM